MSVEHHLLALARIDPNERHTAVTEPHMGGFTTIVMPFITTVSWLQSNWQASPGEKVSGI
jgi:hypothetical protein